MFEENNNNQAGQAPPEAEQKPGPELTGHPIMDEPTALESGRLSQNDTPAPPPPPAAPASADVQGPVLTPKKSHKKLWKIIGLLIVIALIVLGVWIYLLNRSEDGDFIDSDDQTSESSDQATTAQPVVAADTDKDGLDDSRERELGTSPTLADTDADGLTDNEEVTLWNTDPLDPDTDKDGFSDGDEIDNNYNPTGPGTLFDINDIDI